MCNCFLDNAENFIFDPKCKPSDTPDCDWHDSTRSRRYFCEEVFPWFFSFYASISRVGLYSMKSRPTRQIELFLPPNWRHAHAHFGFAHRQQPLRWLKPFLKHWYVKLYELIAPHTLKWINSVIKLGHFVRNIIYCLSRIKFKDRWVVLFIYDSFCWTKSPTAAGLGSRNDAM